MNQALIEGIIYRYESPSGKSYIGKTIDEDKRKRQHRTDTIKEKTKFGNALKKYGYENFKYEVLIRIEQPAKVIDRYLNSWEVFFIEFFDTLNTGYNLTKGGDGITGYKHTDATKEKLSAISNKRVIVKYDLEGNFIEEFKSIADAARTINTTATLRTKSKRLSETCNKKYNQMYGFCWEYKELKT